MAEYYDIKKTLRHNAKINFIIGGRSYGKTFSTKKYVMERFLKHGEQFVWIRRYKTEIQKATENFFGAITSAGYHTELQLKSNRHKLMIDGKIAGFPLQLSTFIADKGREFPDVRWIIQDEFLIEKGGTYRYLTGEAKVYFSCLETIMRDRTDCIAINLANAVTQTNPYFSELDIQAGGAGTIKKYKNGLILVENAFDADFANEKQEKSWLAKITEGTDYNKYAYNNDFYLDNYDFISHKSGFATLYMTLKFNNQFFGLWYDSKFDLFIVSNDHKNAPLNFSLTHEDMTADYTVMSGGGKIQPIKYFLSYYNSAKVYFEDINIKNNFLQLIKKFCR